ncbi:phosphotransferase family protein [Kitasatospora aureofaciens]|uniref:phosphotransferase family protein n=1 Tax=Kitasatospora aureofaciens TaxID=1894 RepID=UPI00068A9BF9|nr:phosphotransferase [Kitasatospora aureofaciens]
MTITDVTAGGYSGAHLAALLDRVCRTVGLSPEGAVLLRGHTNAVYHLPGESVVVKIARRGTPAKSVHRTVALVSWLTAVGFPTVGLHPVGQPVEIDSHLATIWPHLPQPSHPVAAEQLAGPLKALHQLTDPPVALPPVDMVTAIRRSLAAATALTANELAYLRRCLVRLETDLAGITYLLQPSVIQGDPQHRNALHTRDGQAVLCDWDTAGFGQPEWDLTTVEIHCRRFGYSPAHYAAFARQYGLDIRTWDGYPVLTGLRELRMITTNAKRAEPGSDTLTEVRRRIIQMADGNSDQRWNIL